MSESADDQQLTSSADTQQLTSSSADTQQQTSSSADTQQLTSSSADTQQLTSSAEKMADIDYAAQVRPQSFKKLFDFENNLSYSNLIELTLFFSKYSWTLLTTLEFVILH